MAFAGGKLLEVIGNALEAAPWVGVRAEGPRMMWRLSAELPESLDALVVSAARAGVLLKRGAYQFGAVAHDAAALDRVAKAMLGIVESLRPGPRLTRSSQT